MKGIQRCKLIALFLFGGKSEIDEMEDALVFVDHQQGVFAQQSCDLSFELKDLRFK